MNFQTMHTQRKMILIAAVVGLLATLLPWYRVSVFGFSQSINAWHGIGMLAPLGFALAGVMAFLGNQSLPLTSTNWFLALAGGALALLAVIIFWTNTPGSIALGVGGVSFGLYIALIAAIGVLAMAWLHRSPGANLRDGFDSVKRDVQTRTEHLNRSGDSGTV